MQFEIYQWLVPLIGLFYISRTVFNFMQNKRSMTGMVVWITFWVGIIILAAIPNLVAENIARILGIRDVVNAVIFVGIGVLFFYTFYLSSTVERLETKVTDLVRKIALHEVEQTKQENETKEVTKEEVNIEQSDKSRNS